MSAHHRPFDVASDGNGFKMGAPIDSPSFYIATLHSTTFTFKACSTSRGGARQALEKALRVHGEQYQLPDRWWVRFDVEIVEMRTGAGYRDGEEITWSDV